jgi:hypothetical protein
LTSELVLRYVELGLRLGRHVEGLVDSYYGPAEILERVSAEPLRGAAELAGDVLRLLEELEAESDLDDRRRRWLRAQAVGLETVARKLAGESIPYVDEVERCYGVRPQRVPESELEAAHAALDDALPGGGPLAERYIAWREADALEGEQLEQVVERLSADLRERTANAFGLPRDESVDWEFVSEEPWSAFNYYLGGLQSRIAVNTDLPLYTSVVAGTVAHETYPGHHTEHAWKEQGLVRERGQIEEALMLICTPQSFVSEGIAMVGAEVLLGDELDELAAHHLGSVGIRYDAGLARRVRVIQQQLAGVQGNAALLLYEDGVSREEVREYLKRWSLLSEERAEHAMGFLTDPMWRAYVTTYADGERIARAYVDGDADRFRKLLTEQLSAEDLLAVA